MNLFPGIRAFIFATTLCATPAVASDTSYHRQLIRLAEVLGSVHFLQGLCGGTDGLWRSQMESLLEAENPSQERRERLIASFNHGYRSFATTYTKCTESAERAIEHYMKEGQTLTGEIVLRYGE